MSTQKLRAIYKQLGDKIDTSKEAALFEIKELKADLNELQRHLSGRKKETDIQPDDVLRSAYEIAQFLRDIGKREEVLKEMQDVAAETEAEEYLLSRGARLLTRPAGWHFQTAKERFLLHEKDAVQAAAELRKLLAAGKRLKRPKKKKAEPKKTASKEASPKASPKKTAETKTAAKKAKAEKPAKSSAPKAAEKKPKTKKAARQALLPQDATPAEKTAKGSAKKTKAKENAKAAKAEAKTAKKTAAKKPAASKSGSTSKVTKKPKAEKPAAPKKKKTPATK